MFTHGYTQDLVQRVDGRTHKRAKNVNGIKLEEDNEHVLFDYHLQRGKMQPAARKLNRLQRAIASDKRYTRRSYKPAVNSRKLKLAEEMTGVLASLYYAPLDILYEISLYLLPADLLCLSRVSRSLRDFYLSKRSRHIWIGCLASVDLPSCPEDLSEPQYASLVFDTFCIACDAPHTNSVKWALRLRMCRNCLAVNVIGSDGIVEEIVESKPYKIESAEVEAVTKAICRYVPRITRKSYGRRGAGASYYRPDFRDAFFECLTQYRTKSPKDFQAFVKQKEQLAEGIHQHAKELQIWLKQRASLRSSELYDLAERHAEGVIAELRERGYTDEDWDFSDDYHLYDNRLTNQRSEWRAMVYQKRDLSEKTWNVLLPKVETFLKDRRTRIRISKRNDEFDTATLKYCRSLNLTFGELAFALTGHALRENIEVSRFLSYDDYQRAITEEVWDSFIPTIEEIWRKEKSDALFYHESALRRCRGYGRADEAQGLGSLTFIFLASSFFSSVYSDIHQSVYYFNSIHSVGKYPYDAHLAPHDFSVKYPGPRLSQGCTAIDLSVPDALLTDLGLPLNTAMGYMLQLGERFMCCRCSVQFRKVMSWPGLVTPYLNEVRLSKSLMEGRSLALGQMFGIIIAIDHMGGFGRYSQILGDIEVAAVRQQESIRASFPRKFGCQLCVHLGIDAAYYRVTLPQIEEHIRTKHLRQPSPYDIVTHTFAVIGDTD